MLKKNLIGYFHGNTLKKNIVSKKSGRFCFQIIIRDMQNETGSSIKISLEKLQKNIDKQKAIYGGEIPQFAGPLPAEEKNNLVKSALSNKKLNEDFAAFHSNITSSNDLTVGLGSGPSDNDPRERSSFRFKII